MISDVGPGIPVVWLTLGAAIGVGSRRPMRTTLMWGRRPGRRWAGRAWHGITPGLDRDHEDQWRDAYLRCHGILDGATGP
jgi:hypothetical protein